MSLAPSPPAVQRCAPKCFLLQPWLARSIYIGTDSGHVRALDVSTGGLLWQYEASSKDENVLRWSIQGVVYAASSYMTAACTC